MREESDGHESRLQHEEPEGELGGWRGEGGGKRECKERLPGNECGRAKAWNGLVRLQSIAWCGLIQEYLRHEVVRLAVDRK